MNDLEARHALAGGKMVKCNQIAWRLERCYGLQHRILPYGNWETSMALGLYAPDCHFEIYDGTPEPPKFLSFEGARKEIKAGKRLAIRLPGDIIYISEENYALGDWLFWLDIADRRGWPITAVEE